MRQYFSAIMDSSCVFVLSKSGATTLNEKYEDIGIDVDYHEGSQVDLPLWEVLHFFGDTSKLGSKSPFQSLFIESIE